jgi:membrane-associated PAP2 superfamily phosphatase
VSVAPAPAPHGRRDLAITLVSLTLLLAWDASGLDRTVAHAVGGPAGFPWRDAWLTRSLLHDGGRWLSALVLAVLVILPLRRRPGAALSTRAHWGAIGVVLLNLLAVPTVKRASTTSCPWDLAEFGGTARYVTHWDFGVLDGGSGHCFPSGHAVAAFAFIALYFALRDVRPVAARWWLIGSLAAGAVFGAAQVLRGAHFVSHVLWSAWACWTLAAAVDALSRLRRRPQPRPAVAAAGGNPVSPRRA